MEEKMKRKSETASLVRSLCLFIGIVAPLVAFPKRSAADDQFDALLERTSKQVSSFLDLISEMNCTESVLQEKLAGDGKVVEKESSTYDYLVILSSEGGDFNLVESRIAPQDAKQPKQRRSPLLISNGFSTLFLVFHPYYSPGFQFT